MIVNFPFFQSVAEILSHTFHSVKISVLSPPLHTVLVITTKSPENKDFEISEILLKIVFYFT